MPMPCSKQTAAANSNKDTSLQRHRRLLALGPRGIGVKMGARGMRLLLQGGKNWTQIPAFSTQVVDPTGAGDAFCGGFLVGLAQSGSLVQAALYGAVSASFIIEDFGVLHALKIDSDQAHSRLRQLQVQVTHQDSDA